MNSFNENKIDKSTDNMVRNNTNIIMSTDDIKEVNNNSFYGDLSNLNNLSSDTEFMRKLIEECKKTEGYTNRIIYIPVNDWNSDNKQSPANIIIRSIKSNPNRFKEAFVDMTFFFINTKTKENFGIIVNQYEVSQYNTVIGLMERLTKDIIVKAVTGTTPKKTPEKQVANKEKAKQEKKEENKKELVKAIAKKAEEVDSNDPEEILDQIDTDEDIIRILAQVEEDEKPTINKTRAARMSKVNQEFLDSSVGSTTVRSMIFSSTEPIKPAHLALNTVNKDEWENLKFSNFESSYNIDKDIYAMLYSLSENKQYPVSIIKVDVEDTSTSMDYLNTYTAQCEDSFGKRFTLKFDIPVFINDRFMMLRGNEKSMSGQLMLLPCLKTDADTVQLVSNYNKIFVRRYGMAGKSYPETDRLVKVLGKYKGSKIKVTTGDNSLICAKYELPVDYIDLCTNFSIIETKDKVYYFDQDVYFKKYDADLKYGIPYSVDKSTGKVNYYTETDENLLSYIIRTELYGYDEEFDILINNTKVAERLNYSQASILAHKIPLVVMLGYHTGLENLLKRAKIEYRFDKSSKIRDNESVIRFEDDNLIYKISYESSMLLNGLSECDTRNYKVADMDKRATWLDFLDEFGGRILSDGLENFKDLFMDPITKEVCQDCRLPQDYIDLLIYANNLLADNKYNRHTDITGNRYRTNEIVAAYFYIALGKAYEQYANSIRRGVSGATMTLKRTAVIDAILTSNISSDLSTLNPLLELTTASTATFKGPSGMNSDRAYSLDKRTYDESMINKLALSTGFSANVGIDRQTTIDMDVDGVRGYIKPTDPEDMSVTKTMSMSEALTPFGTTSDDPFRSAMTYIQTSKHSMRTSKSAPLLISNGSDTAMPYMNSGTYVVRAEYNGEVVTKTDDYMVIKYDSKNVKLGPDGKPESEYRMINLKETVKKNSDGGFYVTVTLVTSMKEGNKFKAGEILAYDKDSYSKVSESDELGYNLGVLAKVAIMNNDEGFEDSTSVSHWISDALASEVVTLRDTPPLNKSTNIYHIAKVGQEIQEGDPLIIYQNAFDEEDANLLLKSITDEDIVSDLGRIRIRSKYTGVVQDIKIYRTCEIDEMSETMQKIVKDYEKNIKATRAMYKKYNIPGANRLDPDYIMPQTGKLKNCNDGIIIEFYIKYNDKLGVGDKVVAQSANKGVCKDIFPVGLEPFSESNPDEAIHAIFAARSFNARMVTSVFKSGAINKLLIELDRQVKDIMGLPQITVEAANEHEM